MLQIKNVKFLSKIYTPFDAITSPQIIIKVTVDGSFSFPESKGKTTKNQTVWPSQTFPHVELSPKQNDYFIEFTIYKNKVMTGSAKTIVRYGQNIKQHNQILHGGKVPNGIIVYEGQWSGYSPGIEYISWEQFINIKQGNIKGFPKLTKGKEKKSWWNVFTCFITQKPQPKPFDREKVDEIKGKGAYNPYELVETSQERKINRKPVLYKEKELGPIIEKNGENIHKKQPLRKLSYYSKIYIKSG